MTYDCELWKKIIDQLTLENREQFFDGKVDVYFNQTNRKAPVDFVISFPKTYPIAHIDALALAIKKWAETMFKCEDVNVSFRQAGAVSDALLMEYYNQIIDRLIQTNPRYKVLRASQRQPQIVDGVIKVYVANAKEKAIYDDIEQGLNAQFHKYGFHDAIFSVGISDFTVSVEETIARQRQTELEQEQERLRHQKTQARQEPQYKQKGRKFASNRRATDWHNPIPLDKLPATDAELVEYMQKNPNNGHVIVQGELIASEIIEKFRRNDGERFEIFEAVIFDGKDSLMLKSFVPDASLRQESYDFYHKICQVGRHIIVRGKLEYDRYARDVILKCFDGSELYSGQEEQEEIPIIEDYAPVKRVELRAHSKMTEIDSVIDIADLVKAAKDAGHDAVALTDAENIHGFPEFEIQCKKQGIKPIFGLDAQILDYEQYQIAITPGEADLRRARFVAFDFETTGLSARFDDIIQIGAVLIEEHRIRAKFEVFINPHRKLTDTIKEITGITQSEVDNGISLAEGLRRFLEFADGAILVGQNIRFDYKFLIEGLERSGIAYQPFLTIDIMQIARFLYPEISRLNLQSIASKLGVALETEQYHRADFDAKVTGEIFIRMLSRIYENKVYHYENLNSLVTEDRILETPYAYPNTLLVKNATGKRNLYQIVTASHVDFLGSKRTRARSDAEDVAKRKATERMRAFVPRHYLAEHRDGLLIGSGTLESEVFDTALFGRVEDLERIMTFYDFIELQPRDHYNIIKDRLEDPAMDNYIDQALLTIIEIAERLGKPVVATGDVFHLREADLDLWSIAVSAKRSGGSLHRYRNLKQLYSHDFRATEAMLRSFPYLDDATRYRIVVENTRMIMNQIEDIQLFPDHLASPEDDFLTKLGVPSVAQAVEEYSYQRAYGIYGDPLPKFIEDRIKRELQAIISNHFASIYYIAHMLVKRSEEDGYIVGSRGSVGSSIIAYLLGITEVNPLPPHYHCPNCHLHAMKFVGEQKNLYKLDHDAEPLNYLLENIQTGQDLPDKQCPRCGTPLIHEGADIPFETFLGFDGTKVPDIDLNFSGEYQAHAHDYCREIFGKDHAFRSGTITTVASRTAYGYVKSYFEDREISKRNAEINRIVNKIVGMKQTTGQHPGGIVVLPRNVNYLDIIPIQYPSSRPEQDWFTTHFDYHMIEDYLLKLDLLGHDDPTMIRHLMDFVEKYPDEFLFNNVKDIPLIDEQVMGIFKGLEPLGLKPEDVNETVGTNGIPEFGTPFVKEMLADTQPETFGDLLKISGLSHGTDVWHGNAREFMLGTHPKHPDLVVNFRELIGCRDDIMTYLISKSVPEREAFAIMETVRKPNRTLLADQKALMIRYGVPRWYIDCCDKIQYLFPKAHACAYIIMALRIAWFKVHAPIYYYAAYFSLRAKELDYETMLEGPEAIRAKITELQKAISNRTKANMNKEENLVTSLQVALEMLMRGFYFEPISLSESDATHFLIMPDKKGIRMPFTALPSLGEVVAESIITARNEQMFNSLDDLRDRTKLNKTHLEAFQRLGITKDIPEAGQLDFGLLFRD